MLDSLRRVAIPRNGFEVIAVDNASTDNSRQILNSFADTLPIRILSEPTPGKNHALNTAIPLIRGNLAVFTDDDILADRNWLCALKDCADKRSDVDIFGGAITPYWEEPPEPWLHNAVSFGVTFGLTDPRLEDGSVSPDLVWGGNMMVRTRVFSAGHRFDVRIGPKPKQYIMGSETEFTNRLHRLGHKAWFCAEARVSHIVRSHQMELNWIIGRGYRYGRSRYLFDISRQRNSTGSSTFGLPFPRWMLRQFVQDLLFGHLARIRGNHKRAVQLLWNASFLKGYMHQAKIRTIQE